ncbi:MAG: hypothetical protein M0R38_09345 [Bacteroidia bacterium]|nr:hypothetical protein [Bacteroidia bacterium]
MNTNSNNTMKELLKGWNLMRVLYLGMGILIIIQGFMAREWVLAMMGGLLFIMGVFKMGCANTRSYCNTTPVVKKKDENKDITFEEIK